MLVPCSRSISVHGVKKQACHLRFVSLLVIDRSIFTRLQSLDPWPEELLIVNQCIDCLAFMACIETLDPERRSDQPVVTLEALSTQRWSSEMVQEILPDCVILRVIGSLRRQGHLLLHLLVLL